jgi:hypothetical protein
MAGNAYPPKTVAPPNRQDFVRAEDADGRPSWYWELAEGDRVSVTVSVPAGGDGWMVGANRCTAS